MKIMEQSPRHAVITLDGDILLYFYGNTINKVTVPAPNGSTFVKVYKSFKFIVALDSIGRIWTNYGKTSNKKDKISLFQMEPDVNFIDVSCGDDFFVALDDFGNLWSCGYNQSGQLGLGDNVDKVNMLTQVESETTFTSVSCGTYHTLAIDAFGDLWGCGSNLSNELGIVSHNYRIKKLILIPTPFKPTKIFCGDHSVILDNENLWFFGTNKKIGPIKLSINIKNICCHNDQTIILDDIGNIWDLEFGLFDFINNKDIDYSLRKLNTPSIEIVSASCEYRGYISVLDENNNLWGGGSSKYSKLEKILNNVSLLNGQILQKNTIKATNNQL